jgi:hypothetical protein
VPNAASRDGLNVDYSPSRKGGDPLRRQTHVPKNAAERDERSDEAGFASDGPTAQSGTRHRTPSLERSGLAGLKHRARFGWHDLRHAFAKPLRSQPDADVPALGGWKATVTLRLCYQHSEFDRMRQALELLRTESTNGEQTPKLAM